MGVAQLPRVAVLGTGLSSALTLAALVDGGLDAQGVCGADLGPDAVDILSTRGLEGRLRRVDAPVGIAELSSGDGRDSHGPLEIVADGESLGRFDAVVVAYADGMDSPVVGEPQGTRRIAERADGSNNLTEVRTLGAIGLARRFGGVFDPDSDGVYLIGAGSPVGVHGHGHARSGMTSVPGTAAISDMAAGIRELAWAQGSWVGEYLRGRYLLPARSVMLAHPGLPGRRLGWEWGGVAGYLARLDRELRRGRARAAAAGYPLPLPSY